MTSSAPKSKRLTAYGEPLWLDVIKTVGYAVVALLIMFGVGGVLGLMVVAPWGRASHDCSMYCVMEKEIRGFFAASASGSGDDQN